MDRRGNVKSLFPVLGMHRSGATAVTKALEVLGIGPRNGSATPVSGRSNASWADRDCTDINDKLLSCMGVRHPLDLADWGQPPFISGRRS